LNPDRLPAAEAGGRWRWWRVRDRADVEGGDPARRGARVAVSANDPLATKSCTIAQRRILRLGPAFLNAAIEVLLGASLELRGRSAAILLGCRAVEPFRQMGPQFNRQLSRASRPWFASENLADHGGGGLQPQTHTQQRILSQISGLPWRPAAIRHDGAC
jgi:hypothetical protein